MQSNPISIILPDSYTHTHVHTQSIAINTIYVDAKNDLRLDYERF